jgi:Phage protein Gp138 N-terminal domain
LATQPAPNPLFLLTAAQVNRDQFAQFSQIITQALAKARVAIPAFLTADMDVDTQTVTVQIAIQELVRTTNGPAYMDVEQIVFVPVGIQRAGGFSNTLPLKKGDEGFLIFFDACVDFWWINGQNNSPPPTFPHGATVSGSQRQNELRRHYVHDCVFMPCLWSQPNRLPNYSTNSAQMRADDGSAVIDVAENVVTVSGGSEVNITGPTILASDGGAVQFLSTAALENWLVTSVLPFLQSLGYTGPPPPTNSVTTVLKAQ